MEDKKNIITLDLDLKVIHQLYAQAIAWNTTIDEVVEIILQRYIDQSY